MARVILLAPHRRGERKSLPPITYPPPLQTSTTGWHVGSGRHLDRVREHAPPQPIGTGRGRKNSNTPPTHPCRSCTVNGGLVACKFVRRATMGEFRSEVPRTKDERRDRSVFLAGTETETDLQEFRQHAQRGGQEPRERRNTSTSSK